MCLKPLQIVNPSKYVALGYRDRYLIDVPCGHCVECQKVKQKEYYFRSYYEAQKVLDNGGFVLFDTLTYRDADLPRVSHFFGIPSELDFPCFSSHHLRKFVAKLRQRLKRKYHGNFTYFISSEYGTRVGCTHRPHYHVLFFVVGDISPLEFSYLVADCWQYGRTDGKPYKSDYYVLNNTLQPFDTAKSIRIIKYVSKYIAKSSIYSHEINRRIMLICDNAVSNMSARGFTEWSNSLNYKLFKERVSRVLGQFHRQSTEFGASYMDQIDLIQLYKDGKVYVNDNQSVVLAIPLPSYYKRKLFYDIRIVDGHKVWAINDDGVEFREKCFYSRLRDTQRRFASLLENCRNRGMSLDVDPSVLADYYMNYRGRFQGERESLFDERLSNVSLYNYVNRYESEHISRGLYSRFCGNSAVGYFRDFAKRCPSVSIREFISNNVMRDAYYDDALDKMLHCYADMNKFRAKAEYVKERVRNVVKFFS